MVGTSILLAVILVGIAFLAYCFLKFTQDEKHRRSNQAHISPHSKENKIDKNIRCIFTIGLFASPALLSAQTTPATPFTDEQKQIQALQQEIHLLETRIAKLESHSPSEENTSTASQAAALQKAVSVSANSPAQPAARAVPVLDSEDRANLDFLKGTTLNFSFDGYYTYNFNHPSDQTNQLRAYDVSSNSFSINQANIVLEHAPNPAAGNRFGARLDLQYGQATETLQGSPQNEPRPQVYRNLWQAYGTYVAPVGSGLTIDFGKWGSSFGIEGNYTKDQINYSRSYFFDYLPFYHMGVRATYSLGTKASVSGWLVNGTQQTEDFNGFKTVAVLFNLKPANSINWNINYCAGQEQHSAATGTPDGREHIFDTYATWNVTPQVTVVGEADYVINRVTQESAPAHVIGGAAYLRYQATPKWAFAGRTEYLSDHGGLFSGTTQALKEATATAEYKFAEGFLTRAEWRRDFSNIPYFTTHPGGRLSQSQSTATLGLVWWVGRKQGAW